MTRSKDSLRQISAALSLRGRPVCLPWILLPSLGSDLENQSNASSDARGRVSLPPVLAMKSGGAVQA